MVCDWLSATSETTPERLRAVVASLVAAKVREPAERECRPTQAYASAVEWVKDDKRLAVVQWGGTNHELPHVTVPGTGGLSGFIRTELSLERTYGFLTKASRVDVALDFRGHPFEVLSALCGTPSRMIVDADPEAGDTHYFGSRQSRHFVRVYEKGKQMRDLVARDWVRVEVEVKPDQRAAKVEVMRTPLVDLVRTGVTGRRFADAIGLTGNEVSLGGRKNLDHDLARKLRFLRRQYGPTISQLAAACGGDVDTFLDALFFQMDEATLATISGS